MSITAVRFGAYRFENAAAKKDAQLVEALSHQTRTFTALEEGLGLRDCYFSKDNLGNFAYYWTDSQDNQVAKGTLPSHSHGTDVVDSAIASGLAEVKQRVKTITSERDYLINGIKQLKQILNRN